MNKLNINEASLSHNGVKTGGVKNNQAN